MPTIKYKGRSLEVVFEFQYLGVCFSYNNKSNVAQVQFNCFQLTFFFLFLFFFFAESRKRKEKKCHHFIVK